MLRMYRNDTGRLVELDVDMSMSSPGAVLPVWIDVFTPTADEDRYIERLLDISLPTREEMLEIEESSRLYRERGAEFMTIVILTPLDSDDPEISPVTFVLKGGTLVTVRYADPKAVGMIAARAQKDAASAECLTGEHIMLSLIEAFINRMADALEKETGDIDAISRRIFRRRDSQGGAARSEYLQAIIEQIGRNGDLLTKLRESFVSFSRVLSYHATTADTELGRSARMRVNSLSRDVSALSDQSTFLSNKINFLLDATLGLINVQQNQIIKIFSVAAVVFLPPTLIASIYGMNFQHMPELNWLHGYPAALGLMLASAVLPYCYFKLRGWL